MTSPEPAQAPIALLIVEDDAGIVELVSEAALSLGATAEAAPSGRAALDRLTGCAPSLLVLDYRLPDMTAAQLVTALRESGRPVPPFVVMTGAGSEAIAVEAMKLGACDYLPKDAAFIQNLPSVLARVLREITTEQRLRREKEAVEERLAKAFRASPAAISIATLDKGIYVDVNDRFLAISGFRRDEVVGHGSEDVNVWVNTDDRNRFIGTLTAQGRLTNLPMQFRMRSGEVRDFLISSEIIELNGRRCSLNFIADVTDQKRAERALLESETHLRALFEESPVGIWEEDFSAVQKQFGQWQAQGIADLRAFLEAHPDEVKQCAALVKVLDVNQTSVRLFGVATKEALSRRLPDYFTEESLPVFRDELIALAAGHTHFEGEIAVRRPNGERRLLILRLSVLPGHEQTLARVLVTFADVTGRRQAEERERELRARLERAARVESLGVLAGGVAHDLNNILSPLVTLPDFVEEYLAGLGRSGDPDLEEAVESVRIVKQMARRAASVVSDLVVMGRRGQIQRVRIDLNQVIRQALAAKEVLALHESRPDVVVSAQCDPEPLWLLGSDSRLARVLLNLILNAADAVEGQGDIAIRTLSRRLPAPLAAYELIPAGDYVVVQIADTGCGMSPEILGRLFEPFFTTKASRERSGSGLGLSVVHGLLKDHHGFIDVQSAPGRGTSFTLYFPAAPTDADPPPAERQDSTPAGGSERVLVVDDEPALLASTRLALRSCGYQITTVPAGAEAVALFETARQAGQPAPFDLVILDMIMGEMSGATTYRKILDLYPGQKAIVVSGHAPDALRAQVLDLGADWLSKPYEPAELASAVRKRLDRR